MKAFMKGTLIISIIASINSACGEATNKDENTSDLSTEETLSAMTYANTRDELPICSNDSLNQVVYVKEDASLLICDGHDFVAVSHQGQDGATGDKGETGAQGSQGAQGDEGDSLTIYISDDNNANIGYLATLQGVSEKFVKMSDSNIASLNLKDETITGIPLVVNSDTGNLDTLTLDGCNYLSNDCSGECYVASNSDIRLIKGVVIRGTNGLLIVKGDETHTSNLQFKSQFYYNSPHTCAAFTQTLAHSYKVTTSYSLPANIVTPFANLKFSTVK